MVRLTCCLLVVAVVTLSGCGDGQASDDAGTDASLRVDGDIGCASAGCGDPTLPHCDPLTDRCVACVEASHCTNPAAALCLGGSCEPCLTNGQCMDQLDRPQCRSDGRCVQCQTAADCSALAPHCTIDGRCVECLAESDCSDQAPACASGSCRSCTETTCTPTQKLRELFALQCAAAIRSEGVSEISDAFEALFCSNRPGLFALVGYLQRAVEAGRIEIDEKRFADCGAAESLPLFDEGACGAALRGTVADGGVCGVSLECVSGRCDVPDATCAGTCVARESAGAPCSDDDECADELICLDAFCQAPPFEGAGCTTRCAGGLFCNASGICEVQRDVGSACRGGDCQEGLSCRSNRCAAPPAEGATCWPEYLTRCADGLRCVGTTCRTPGALGTACTSTSECAFGARCHAGACAAIVGLGGACDSTSACALGTGCRDGRCGPLPDLGEPCFAAGCLRGVCRDGTCQAQAPFTPCAEGIYPFDVLDPCGGASSCTETPSGWQCAPEGGPGASCGGPSDLNCREPDLHCDSSRTCVAYCSP